jgi:hypothetical protein
VAGERHAGRAEHVEGRAEVGLADMTELVHAGGEQKALEAEHAGAAKRLEVGQVTRHHAAVKADVDPALAGRGGLLGFQAGHGRRRRDRVERHVDDGGDAAGRRRPRGAGEALPLGAARLVDMHVAVDQARRDDQIAGVVERRAGRQLAPSGDIGDDACLDVDGGRPHGAVDDDAPAANHEVG